MENVKHTPGPWWIWKERAGYDTDELLDEAEHVICAGTPTKCTPSVLRGGDGTVCTVGDFEDCNEEAETRLANARLIAAAPELLAACKAAAFALLNTQTAEGRSLASPGESGFQAYQLACAALAQAEGGK